MSLGREEPLRRVVAWLNGAELLCLFILGVVVSTCRIMGVLVWAVCSKAKMPCSLNGFGASSRKLPCGKL